VHACACVALGLQRFLFFLNLPTFFLLTKHRLHTASLTYLEYSLITHLSLHLTASTMVHLGKVATDRDIADSKLPELENLDIGAEDQNEITTSVYGSRFAAQDLPKHEMPDGEMPREMAYRLIKDDLTLDGNPTLK
jgi:hypothetical protein